MKKEKNWRRSVKNDVVVVVDVFIFFSSSSRPCLHRQIVVVVSVIIEAARRRRRHQSSSSLSASLKLVVVFVVIIIEQTQTVWLNWSIWVWAFEKLIDWTRLGFRDKLKRRRFDLGFVLLKIEEEEEVVWLKIENWKLKKKRCDQMREERRT